MHVAEANNNLSELIDRALSGEGVLITRHGKPVVEFKPVPVPVPVPVGPVSDTNLQWLAANRLRPQVQPSDDAGKLLSDLRDEDAH